ncbi:MAG: hypothetical protein ACPGJV_12115 [Bacteriovoracaceae bacterium]
MSKETMDEEVDKEIEVHVYEYEIQDRASIVTRASLADEDCLSRL